MNLPGVADVVARVSDAAFGRPLVTNVLRGHVAEAIVALALEPEWRWCSANYAAWDFEREGIRLEVKQSAMRQSWAASPTTVARPKFDVRERTGHYDETAWIDAPGRQAHLYIFCLHERSDAGADHRNPAQWTFFVVPTSLLPPVKSVGIASVRRLASGVDFRNLGSQVDLIAEACRRDGLHKSA